ncbi:MAG: VanW family protein [Patescibacteria group bacterium]|nr:VanW family protein [Patescibacteria group bacterium]MDD5172792.1 VanW family protein [Patescibacteria group bacterium]
MNFEETEFLIKSLTERMEKQGFSFSVETELGAKKTVIKPQLISLTDPDLSRQLIQFNIQETLDKIFEPNHQRVKKIINPFLSLVRSRHVDLVFKMNEEEIKRILENEFNEFQHPAKNAFFVVESGIINLKDEQPGFIFDYQEAIGELKNNLKNFENQEIKITVIQKEPEIKVKDVNKAFFLAQEIFNSAPYYLFYQGKKWTILQAIIGDWLKLDVNEIDDTIGVDFDQEKIINFFQPIAEEINITPINQKLEIKDGKVTEFQVGRSGYVLNPVVNAEKITREILDGKKEISLQVDEIGPTPLSDDINTLGIKELVGEGSSNFAGSPKNRRINIKLGAEKLHGLLIKPDQEFSLIEAIGPVDEASGFLPELVIKGDRTVAEYGGGLCQIGTTMFRLAINAGLPITERSPHSYRVVYYEPAGMDATIYNPHPDLRFINDTGHYLLLQTEIKGDDLIFKFFGTSDNRQVETTKPIISNITSPGPAQYIETTELLPGEKRRIESSHFGADAEFKNIITFPNGIVREENWKSRYRPWPEVWLVGKKIEEEARPVETESAVIPDREQETLDEVAPHQ